MTNEAQMPITDEARYLAQYQADSTATISTVNVYDKARKALAEITAIEGAANGPWRLSEVWRHPVGYGPHNDLNHEGKVFWGYSLSCSSEHGGHISPTMGMIYNFPDKTLSNAQHIAACDPATMQAIAALVEAQDAQIAALRDELEACHFYLKQHYNNVMDGDEEYDLIQSAASALNATTEAAKAYDDRIRADERERCLTVIQHYKEDYGPQYQDDKLGELLASHFDRIAESIRNMEGE